MLITVREVISWVDRFSVSTSAPVQALDRPALGVADAARARRLGISQKWPRDDDPSDSCRPVR